MTGESADLLTDAALELDGRLRACRCKVELLQTENARKQETITDLLAACEAAKSWLATFIDDEWDGITRQEAEQRAEEVIQEANAAIAKARGED